MTKRLSSLLARIAVAVVGLTMTVSTALAANNVKVSSFGQYSGYSRAIYDGYRRQSVYVAMRDGTRLAVDLYFPTLKGRQPQARMPVVFSATPYGRAWIKHGKLRDAMLSRPVGDGDPSAGHVMLDSPYLDLSRRGYIFALADVRGQGASFGGYAFSNSAEEARDCYDLTQWLASQPWSTGKVGMYGNSYLGEMQYLAASEAPPALKAIFPSHVSFDIYDMFKGGIWPNNYLQYYADLDASAGRAPVTAAPVPVDEAIAPVDGPDGPALLVKAIEEHRRRDTSMAITAGFRAAMRTRDGAAFLLKPTAAGPQNLSARLGAINRAAIPAYHWGGWNDYVPDATLRWFANYKGAQKLVMGPWAHHPIDARDRAGLEGIALKTVEAARWFDYWLKGIRNGVMDGAPVRFAVTSNGQFSARDVENGYKNMSWTWRTAKQWPPADMSREELFLASGGSGSVASVNDGRLVNALPLRGNDVFAVDPTVSTGMDSRLNVADLDSPLKLPDMRVNDSKSLTYTGDVLTSALLLAGAPIVTVVLESSASDGDIFAWIEDVDESGYSSIVAFGAMRASHRTIRAAPYDNLGEPWLSSLTEDIARAAPLDRAPAKLQFALSPVAARISAGHRIRLTLAGADAGNFDVHAAGASVKLHYGQGFESSVVLPVLKSAQ